MIVPSIEMSFCVFACGQLKSPIAAAAQVDGQNALSVLSSLDKLVSIHAPTTL
jgi:hypothetical protein